MEEVCLTCVFHEEIYEEEEIFDTDKINMHKSFPPKNYICLKTRNNILSLRKSSCDNWRNNMIIRKGVYSVTENGDKFFIPNN